MRSHSEVWGEHEVGRETITRSFKNLSQMMSLPCVIPPKAPTVPKVKSQSLPTIPRCSVVWHLPLFHLIGLHCLLTYCIPDPQTSLLLSLKHTNLTLAPGTLHLLWPLPKLVSL